MPPLELAGGIITEGGMAAARIVETLDEVEDGHAGLGLGPEAAAVEQLALEGCEEALTHRVIEAVSDRAHRGADARLATAEAEGDRGVLAALIRVVDDV